MREETMSGKVICLIKNETWCYVLDFILNLMFRAINSFARIIWLSIISFAFGLQYRIVILWCVTIFSGVESKIYKAEKALGRSLVGLLHYAGPSFIKLGQILATRPDVVGEGVAEELSKLQDCLPPFPFNKVKIILKDELKGKIKDHFFEIDPTPVAAASIAQVHKAITYDGEIVAVKILRPNIEKYFARDLALFKFISRIVIRFSPSLSRLKLDEILKILADTVKFELDLRYEAAAADTIRENCISDSGIKIPKVLWGLTSKRVLTMEWIDGIPVHEREKLIAAGHDLHEISKKLAVTFFNQAYRDGFFHADLHPGNIFIDTNGDIALVDFGIIGVLSHTDRLLMAEILHGFITRNYKKVAEIHFVCGYVPRTQDATQFTLACRSIGEPIVGMPANKIFLGRLLKQLFEVSATFDMPLQTQLLLLQKTMITIEGVGISIYPDVNMWKLAEPWIKDWAKKNFGIRGKYKTLRRNMSEMVDYLPYLVSKLDKIIALTEENLKNKINQNKKP